jgi:photosystem I subunit 11
VKKGNMIINKANTLRFLSPSPTQENFLSKLPLHSQSDFSKYEKPMFRTLSSKFNLITPFKGDPFIGHLSTPITTSNITKSYLSLLPAYKQGLSPLLRGISIGYVHGYFLLGPFVKLGPLRDSEVANFVGFVSTLSFILILTTALLIYGYVTFSEEEKDTAKIEIDFLSFQGWKEFTSGFILGGFGGTSIAYMLLKIVPISVFSL